MDSYNRKRAEAYTGINQGDVMDTLITCLTRLIDNPNVDTSNFREEDIELLDKFRAIKELYPVTEFVDTRIPGLSQAETDYANTLEGTERSDYLAGFGISE